MTLGRITGAADFIEIALVAVQKELECLSAACGLSPRLSLQSRIVARAVNVHEAKTGFSKLLRRVQQGEEIVIARAGQPVARLVPFARPPSVRKPGSAKGRVTISTDFDAPLPRAIQKVFE